MWGSIKALFTSDLEIEDKPVRDTAKNVIPTTKPYYNVIKQKHNSTVLGVVNDIVNTAIQVDISLKNNGRDALDNKFFQRLRYNTMSSGTFVDFMTQMLTNYLLYGESFALIVRNGKGYGVDSVERIEPIDNKLMKQIYKDPETDELFYRVEGMDEGSVLSSRGVIHFRNLSLDGVNGFNMLKSIETTRQISAASDTQVLESLSKKNAGIYLLNKSGINNDKSEEEWLTQVKLYMDLLAPYTNGENIPLIDPDDVEIRTLENITNLHKPAEIEELVRERVALTLNYPMARFSKSVENIEQSRMMVLIQTCEPIFVRFEYEMTRKLLSQKEINEGYTVRFNRMATGLKEKSESISKLVRSGVMEPDEGRDILYLAKKGGAAGELYVSADLIKMNNEEESVHKITGNGEKTSNLGDTGSEVHKDTT